MRRRDETCGNYKIRSLNTTEKIELGLRSILKMILSLIATTILIKLVFGVCTTYVLLIMDNNHMTFGYWCRLLEGTILILIVGRVLWYIISDCIPHWMREVFLLYRNCYVYIIDITREDSPKILLYDEFKEQYSISNFLDALNGGAGEEETDGD